MTNPRTIVTRSRYLPGVDAFARWSEDVRNGTGPVLFQHSFPYPEIGPDLPPLNGTTSRAIIWWCHNQRRAFHATRKERTGRADHPLCCERSKSRWDEARPLPRRSRRSV